MRVRTGVVIRGSRDDVLDLAERYNVVTAPPTLVDARSSGTAHTLEIEARWTSDGKPLVFDRAVGDLFLPDRLSAAW